MSDADYHRAQELERKLKAALVHVVTLTDLLERLREEMILADPSRPSFTPAAYENLKAELSDTAIMAITISELAREQLDELMM